tara:strand:+ start:533 stop:775 length:243 start_codon:yes stop_codon:yes gene_type:complete
MFKKITEHLEDKNETYCEHMLNAWKIVILLKKLEIKCAIHSILPFVYTDAVSSKIDCLQKMTTRTESEQDEDLYEVYGGD